MDVVVHASWYGKVPPGLTPTSDVQEREREREKEKGSLIFTRAGLSSYLYRPCITCVSPSMLGAVSLPPQ